MAKRGSPPWNVERDQEIKAAVQKREGTLRALGKRFGMSAERVRQIASRDDNQKGDTVARRSRINLPPTSGPMLPKQRPGNTSMANRPSQKGIAKPKMRRPPPAPTPDMSADQIEKVDFSRRLWQLMTDRNMNQAQLSRETGIGPDAISVYMRARSIPDVRNRKVLADYFDITIDELLPRHNIVAVRDDQNPSFQLKSVQGHPDKTWLIINRIMSFKLAATIITLLQEEDANK